MALTRIVHEEQSQRGIHLVGGCCAQIMEPASEPRIIEVRRFPALKEKRVSSALSGIANQGGTAEALRSLSGKEVAFFYGKNAVGRLFFRLGIGAAGCGKRMVKEKKLWQKKRKW